MAIELIPQIINESLAQFRGNETMNQHNTAACGMYNNKTHGKKEQRDDGGVITFKPMGMNIVRGC